MRGVEIRVTHTAGLGPHENLARPGRGYVQFPKDQGLSELLDNCGVHLIASGDAPLLKQGRF
jgi:hypothetical protein